MRTDRSTEELVALMAAMETYGILILKTSGVYLRREPSYQPNTGPNVEWRGLCGENNAPQQAAPEAPEPPEPPSTLSSASPTEDDVPTEVELELKERELEHLKLIDPYEYEQAIMRDELVPSKDEDESP